MCHTISSLNQISTKVYLRANQPERLICDSPGNARGTDNRVKSQPEGLPDSLWFTSFYCLQTPKYEEYREVSLMRMGRPGIGYK